MPNLDFVSFPFVSVAHAEVKTYVASDTAMCDFGEDDPDIVKVIQAAAQSRAIELAKEQAGIYIKSYTKIMNSTITEDAVSTMTNTIVDIMDVMYKKLPYEAQDTNENDTGKIGVMYEATVTVKIDSDVIEKYLKLDFEKRRTLEIQNKEVQKFIDENNKELETLEKNSIYVKTTEEQNKIKTGFNKSYNELLVNQKLIELSHELNIPFTLQIIDILKNKGIHAYNKNEILKEIEIL